MLIYIIIVTLVMPFKNIKKLIPKEFTSINILYFFFLKKKKAFSKIYKHYLKNIEILKYFNFFFQNIYLKFIYYK